MQIVTSALSRVSGMVFGSVHSETSPQDQPDVQTEAKSPALQETIADMPKATRSQSTREATASRQRTESSRMATGVTYNYPSSHPPAATILSDDRRREERRKDRYRVSSDRRISKEELSALEERNRALENRLQEALSAFHSAESRSRALESQLAQQSTTLHHAEQEKAQISQLLEIRTTELKAAQAFLTTADKWSENEVISKVQALNSEILQAAAQASEPLIHQRPEGKPTFTEDVARYLGKRNMSLLETRLLQDNDNADHLMQIFLQYLMLYWSTRIIKSWNLWDNNVSDSLYRIYSGIKRTEDPSVARRWRAMTQAQLGIPSEAQEHLGETILKNVESFLRSCGQVQGVGSLKNRILTIVRLATEIRVAIGEEVTSASLEMYLPRPEELFEPTTMEDEDGNAKAAREKISCCSQVGMYRDITIRNSDGSLVNQQNVLLKPKIVLYSSLRD
ncbi:hypothetical protein BDQ17DRAFT_1414233 [Cyathus striatus]|nr:hypothetical protein BDQ17DRAFT_1414233 [Cyathus striatus]